jgi:hypothetical protein
MFDIEGLGDRSAWMTFAGTLRASPSIRHRPFGSRRRSTDVGNAEVNA